MFTNTLRPCRKTTHTALRKHSVSFKPCWVPSNLPPSSVMKIAQWNIRLNQVIAKEDQEMLLTKELLLTLTYPGVIVLLTSNETYHCRQWSARSLGIAQPRLLMWA